MGRIELPDVYRDEDDARHWPPSGPPGSVPRMDPAQVAAMNRQDAQQGPDLAPAADALAQAAQATGDPRLAQAAQLVADYVQNPGGADAGTAPGAQAPGGF